MIHNKELRQSGIIIKISINFSNEEENQGLNGNRDSNRQAEESENKGGGEMKEQRSGNG